MDHRSKNHKICLHKKLIAPGPPGLGKSTTAQLLSREHGFVYYEGDCFWALRNPYVSVDAKEATLAQLSQTKLVGAGLEVKRFKYLRGSTLLWTGQTRAKES